MHLEQRRMLRPRRRVRGLASRLRFATASTLIAASSAVSQPAWVERYSRTYAVGEEDTSPEVRESRRLADGTWVVASIGPSLRLHLDRVDETGLALSSRSVRMERPFTLHLDPFGDALALLDASYVQAPRVRKLAGETGETIWLRSVDLSPGYARDVSHLVDASGDVLLFGRYQAATGAPVRFSAKLAGSTGRLLWGPVLLGEPADGKVRAAIDASGDVVLAAMTPGTTRARALPVRKISADSGATVWSYVLGPVEGAGPDDFRLAVSPSRTPIVLVKGRLEAPSRSVSLVVKLDAGDGRPLWQRLEPDLPPTTTFDLLADEGGGALLTFDGATGSTLVRLRSGDGLAVWSSSGARSLAAAAIVLGGDALVLEETAATRG